MSDMNQINTANSDFEDVDIDQDEVADQDFVVTFRDINYSVAPSVVQLIKAKVFGHKLPGTRVILSGLSGQVKCGQMTAIMGPSASGKSVLLECLIGKRFNGLVGSVTAHHHSGPLKIAYIPQQDKVYGGLTVREAVVYASKFQNYGVPNTEGPLPGNDEPQNGGQDIHNELAVKVMTQLGLMVCSDTRISSCSGGQQKRVSIAMELVSRPSILVLDEPTSGLDSAACQAVVELLSDIAKGSPKVAVIVTIHQPSWHVFKLFDKVFMLSKETGNAIYEGPPTSVVPTLAHFGCICPDNYNPADYLIEVACGSEGDKVVKDLTNFQVSSVQQTIRDEEMVPKERLLDIIRNPDFPFMAHFLLLFQRSLILMLRDPWLLTIRFAVHIMCGLCMWAVFKDTGAADGCPPRVPATLDNMDVFQDIKKSYIHDVMRTYANVSAIFFSALFLVFTAMMPTVLTFSSEINILCKEVFNKWYSLTPFYLAKVFAELPLLVILPVMYVTIVYYGTENPHVSWRFFSFTGLMVLNCVVGHAQGSLISIVFVDHPAAGVYVTPVTMVPIMVLSGFFIHVSEMKKMFIVTSYASYVRFVVEAAVVVVYGYDRCGLHVRRQLNQAQNVLLTWIATSMGFDRAWPTGDRDNVTRIAGGFDPIDTANRLADSIVGQMLRDYVGQDGQVRSRLMNEFSVDEDDLWPDIAITVATLVFYRILAYFILYRRVNLMN